MPTIAATATVTPPYLLPRVEVKDAVSRIFRLDPRRLAALMDMYDHALVDQRYSVLPLDQLIKRRSLTEKMQDYRKHAVLLGSQAVRCCLERAGLRPSDVDLLISVSCTGYMIPSLDAYLVQELGFRPNVRRLPITELGCVGGAAALARASEFVAARPGSHALIVAVELSSLAFQPEDLSDANLISCALFGDGAAAALITEEHSAGARVLDTESWLIPDSLDAMGFDLTDTGFHMVLSREIPDLVRREVPGRIDDFLARNRLDRNGLSSFVLHPGGRKILEQLEKELELTREATQPSWDVLRRFGNLSSATIIFVLDEWLRCRQPASGEHGLAIGLGPGVSAELLLLQWV
jgi:alkylresorcinol/alkylpyrone synthase